MTKPAKAVKRRKLSKPGGLVACAPEMPSLRQSQRLLARDRILEAAVAEFAERGYASTTIDDIAGRAGLSRATLYLHFKNRRDIIAAFAAQNISEFRELFSAAPLRENAPQDELEAWIDRLFAFYDRTRNKVIVYYQAQAIDYEVQQMIERNFMLIIRDIWPKASGGRRWPGAARGSTLVKRLRLYIGLTDSTCFMAIVIGVVPLALARAELASLWRKFFTI